LQLFAVHIQEVTFGISMGAKVDNLEYLERHNAVNFALFHRIS